ncbi:thyroglobulin [Anabrus simplex]|uniref:thyroglobulin n=1 Tax=Anabrus simplex TaxID=316456 RepID=UPI0035A33DB4
MAIASQGCILAGAVFSLLLVIVSSGEHGGRCPALLDWNVCPKPAVKCELDRDCSSTQKCCPTPCGNSCVRPLYTGCEQVQREAERRAKSLGPEGASVRIPKCNSQGDFDEIQCDPQAPRCWCVDEAGFEVPGTRAPARNLVNCTNPKPCGSATCRMLCPHGFALQDDGCPRCECRDPCQDVKCPGSLSCQLEDVACANQPCPPIPRCKRARSLENICPAGEPLMITGSERPFLCGTSPGKPQCPPLFQCIVQAGNDYGVCCPSSFKIQKPGTCPAKDDTDEIDSIGCGMRCEHDLECTSMQKCCVSDRCGKHCTQPQNVTVCLQQKMLAELLVMNEREGKGYVPQCSPITGQFETRQCSRNGLVCWCVDSVGNKLPGSMGPSEKVVCPVVPEARAKGRSLTCDRNMCAQMCEYGFKVGTDGCPTCECDNPCEGFECAPGEECVAVRDEGCSGFMCATFPVCRPKTVYVNPCNMGTPLSDPLTGDVVVCNSGQNNEDNECPKSHECTYIAATAQAVCCPRREPVEPTKLGLCPFLMIDSCQNVTTCQTDSGCEGDMKCCYTSMCGAVCADPLLPSSEPAMDRELESVEEEETPRPQSMCEYLRDFSDKMEGTREGMVLALPPPACTEDGSFDATQCRDVDGQKECWCVDEFGSEIPQSRSFDATNCTRLREELDCLGMTCRLGCDYGFVMDPETRCPRCECRNPCDSIDCAEDEECHIVEVNCEDEYCPPVPSCLPKKPGQCPYLVPVTSGNCDYECRSDHNCNVTAKCCSNGCGTRCVEPVMMTACQHQRAILEHKSHETGTPARQMFMPQCREEDGGYEPVQCHPVTRQCWCVDEKGEEVAGTRAPPDVQPSCHTPSECPKYKCQPCEHGYRMDMDGCPTCDCRDPCEEISCRGDGEACRLVEVSCVDRPCPPVPMCLPRRDNPCLTGHPLLVKGSSEVLQCGPNRDTCPSSHRCHLSPLGEYAVCCPKPRAVCFQPIDIGLCQTTPRRRWYFNPEKDKCEEIEYGGCGATMNDFESEEICNTVCPVLSQCERLREKNQKAAEKYKKQTFTPRCDPDTGYWEPIQCLEHVGVCWCVNRAGEPIKGSLTRGAPSCNARQGRRRMHVGHTDQEMAVVLAEMLKDVAMLVEEEEILGKEMESVQPLMRTRCQALRQQMVAVNAAYTVECDTDGRFAPIQCYPRNDEKFPECWCVDEAGNQLPNTTTFRRGAKICFPTPVKAVDVTLGFHGHYSSDNENHMAAGLKAVLDKLKAKVKNGAIDVEIFPDSAYIRFSLVGSNKVDVAYHLEEMVKSHTLRLEVDDGTLATADITSSRFSNRLVDDSSNEVQVSDRVVALEHREVVSQSTVSVVTPYQTAIIVLSIGSAFIICVLVLVIVLYRRKMSIRFDGADIASRKGVGLDKHFLAQSAPIYVVSLPNKAESFPRVGITSGEDNYEGVTLTQAATKDSETDKKPEV